MFIEKTSAFLTSRSNEAIFVQGNIEVTNKKLCGRVKCQTDDGKIVWIPEDSLLNNTSPPVEEKKMIEAHEPEYIYHTLRRGETVYTVAKMYNTTPQSILSINNMKTIAIGCKLKIRKL